MKNPKVLAVAEFSRDMAESLVKFFDQYDRQGVVEIEVTDHGLWWKNPNGTKQFLGSVRQFPSEEDSKIH